MLTEVPINHNKDGALIPSVASSGLFMIPEKEHDSNQTSWINEFVTWGAALLYPVGFHQLELFADSAHNYKRTQDELVIYLSQPKQQGRAPNTTRVRVHAVWLGGRHLDEYGYINAHLWNLIVREGASNLDIWGHLTKSNVEATHA